MSLRKHVSGLAAVTPMERTVLRLLAGNLTTAEISQRLHISRRTVETHRANVCLKLNLHGPHRLLGFAVSHRAEL